MKNYIIQSIGLAVLALGICRTPAQVLMTVVTNANYNYNQNFNSLPSNPGNNPWLNNVTLTGWYLACSNSAAAVVGDVTGCTNIVTSSGSSTGGAIYNFTNATTPADHCLGSLSSGTPQQLAYGVRFTNDTGIAASNFVVSYTGEQWRNGGNTSQQPLSFFYKVSSVGGSITNSDATNNLNIGWNAVAALNFISPIATASAGALDGNNAANRTVINNVQLAGVVVLPGQEIFLRWVDINDAGNDHGLAIDDLTVTFTNIVAGAVAPTFTANPASATLREGDPLIASVAVNGTQPISFYWFTIESGVTNLVGIANPQTIYSYTATGQSGNKFFAIASNSVGAVTSSTATLTVTSSVPIPATIAFLRTLRNPTTYAVTDQTNLYTIDGIVTTPNVISGPLQSYFVQDATGGMDVFNRDGAFPLPAVGDHVKITGPLFNFNGLLEMNITNANPSHHVLNLGAGTLPTPAGFDFASASNPTLMENSIEGTLVTVSNVFLGFTNGVFFTAGGTIFMTNSTGGRFNISIPSDTIGDMVNKTMQSPPYASSVTGVISQNTTSVPTNGYSLLVYYYANINFTNNVGAPIPVTLAKGSLTNSVISWPVSLMSLQSSTNVQGPYVTIPGATSPYTNDMTTNDMNFFRLVY